jgi:hypothetical protein
MEIRLIRHATVVVGFDGRTFPVDPMVGSAGNDAPDLEPPNDHRTWDR